MLGLFGPRCPLETNEKAWVEWRMRWLSGRFGLKRMRDARVVLPTNEFFPDTFTPDRRGAQECLELMCGYMGIDPGTVSLEIVADDNMPGAAGLYQMRAQSNICVAESQLAAPPQLPATLAHELAHELLLKGGHISQDESDQEHVTDLLPVFLGTGIFLANATVQSTSTSSGNLHSWSISRQGYLNSIVLGYALAVFAYVRGEDRPQWARHLRTDAAVTLRAGLGYLLRTGDSLFRPDATEGPRPRPTPDDVTERLGNRSPTVRLGALWDMRAVDPSPIELVPAVEGCLRDRDPDVRREAAKALGRFGSAAARAVPQLVQAADRGPPANRAAALFALGAIRPEPTEILPTLTYALRDDSYEVASAAAAAIGRYGPAAVSAEPALLTAIEAAALTDYHRLIQLVAALRAVSADPRARIREHFAGSDGEIRRLALGVLKDQGG